MSIEGARYKWTCLLTYLHALRNDIRKKYAMDILNRHNFRHFTATMYICT